MNGWRCAFVALLLTGSVPAPAGPVDWTELATEVDAWRRSAGVPGLAWAVVQNGAVVHAAGCGTTGPNGGPVTASTVFAIGSLTKSFTSQAVQTLAEQGRLRLDASLTDYLPDLRFTGAGRAHPPTLADLLAHRSGLSRRLGYAGIDDPVARVRKLDPVHLRVRPGARFEYSNANYELLGAVLDRIGGYPQLLQQTVLGPLGLPARFADRMPAGAATGHRDWFGIARPMSGYGVARSEWPSGGLLLSAAELARYLMAHFAGGMVSGLSAAGFDAWHRVAADSPDAFYAWGWYHRRLGDGVVLAHEGQTAGFTAAALFDPDARWAVVVLTNGSALPLFTRPHAQQIAGNIARRLLGLESRWDGFAGLATITWLKRGLLLITIASIARWLYWRRRRSLVAAGGWIWRLAFGLLLAAGLLAGIPTWLGLPLGALLSFTPDLGLLLLLGSILSICGPVIDRLRLGRQPAAVPHPP